MSLPPAPKISRRELAHRVLLWSLGLILVAISCWCLLLLSRSWNLRQDLDLHHDWLDDLRRARLELQQPTADLAANNRWAFLDGLDQSLDQRGLGGEVTSALQQTSTRLQSSLDTLREALLASDLDPAPRAERVADAAFTVSKAIAALEHQVQVRVESLYRQLDGHWRALNALVAICLVLCASNLGLLHLAHRRRSQLEVARDRALQLASHDPLTGLWNRDAILRMLRRELARAERLGTPIGIVLANIDRFREVNGLLGPENADTVLQEIGWRLGSMVRPYDTLGRFGGDEFLMVLPTCDDIATANIVQRIRQTIESEEIDYGLGRLKITLSVGYAVAARGSQPDPDLLIHRLQEALRDSQADGPGRVVEIVPPARPETSG